MIVEKKKICAIFYVLGKKLRIQVDQENPNSTLN